MKRLLTILLAVLMVFCVFSCDKEDEGKPVYEYYENGNLKQSIEYDDDGYKYVKEYREDGKILKDTTDYGDGVVWITTYEYDENANLIKSHQTCEKYKENNVTLYQYFDNGNRKTEEYYSKEVLQYRVNYSEDGSFYDTVIYDEEGNVTATTRTNVTHYDDGSYLEFREDRTGLNTVTYHNYYDKNGENIWACIRMNNNYPIRIEMWLDDNTQGFFSLISQREIIVPVIRQNYALGIKLGFISEGGNYSDIYNVSEYFSEKSEKVEIDGKTYTKISLFFKDKVLVQETIISAEALPMEDYDFPNVLVRNIIYFPDGEVLYDTEADDSIYIVKDETYGENLKDVVGYVLEGYNSTGKLINSKHYDLENKLLSERNFEYDENGNKIEVRTLYDENGDVKRVIYYDENGNVIS